MFKRLVVPHFKQIRDGFCLPACVEMVLGYWGLEQEQSQLAAILQTVPGAGTSGSKIKLLASKHLNVIYESGELRDLRMALENDIPPIALVWTGELPYWKIKTPHAVVVTGINDELVWLNDPAEEKPDVQITIGDFYLAWDVMANLYALLLKG